MFVCVQGCRKKKRKKSFFSLAVERVRKKKKRVARRRQSPSTGHPSKLIAKRESYILAPELCIHYTVAAAAAVAFSFFPFVCRQCIRTSLVTFPVRPFSSSSTSTTTTVRVVSFLLPFVGGQRLGAQLRSQHQRSLLAKQSRWHSIFSPCRMSHSCVCISSGAEKTHTHTELGREKEKKKERRRSGRISSICLFAGE